MRFRKKPVEIDAVLWDETKETLELLKGMGMKTARYDSHVTENYVRNLRIITREGSTSAEKGDWIIKVESEFYPFYPCKPHIFAATYDAV